MVVFRENTEDIYTGIEFEARLRRQPPFHATLREHFPKEYAKIRFQKAQGLG
jgi:isocitrate dehydrogenase